MTKQSVFQFFSLRGISQYLKQLQMKYTKFTDKSGNINIQQLPYKSRTAALLFDPITINRSKTSFGGQLKDHSGTFIYDKARVGYRAKQQSDQIFQNVGNYILQYRDDSQRLNLFKNALQTRITDAKTRVSDYNIEQLSDFLPWVMSCQFLFQPLRSYMFCLANGISHQNANEVKSRIPGEMINNQVNKAIRKAVLQNNSLIEEAKNIYSLNNIGYIIKGFRAALQLSQNFKNFVEKAWQKMTQGAKKAYKAFSQSSVVKVLGGFFESNQIKQSYVPQRDPMFDEKPAQVAGAMKFFDELATQIFKQLRVYGQIVVNMNYIRITGIRKIIDGKLLYYYLQRPNLLFGIQNSFLSVYTLQQNGNVVPVLPRQFTLQYLRKLVQGQVVGLGGRMFKSIKDDITQTKEDKEGFQKFSSKFLQWDNLPPTVPKGQLSKYNQKTSVKRETMSKKDAQRAKRAYQQREQLDESKMNKQLLNLMKRQNQFGTGKNDGKGIKPSGEGTATATGKSISAAEQRLRDKERKEEIKQLRDLNLEQFYELSIKNYEAARKRRAEKNRKQGFEQNNVGSGDQMIDEQQQDQIKADLALLSEAQVMTLNPNDSFAVNQRKLQ